MPNETSETATVAVEVPAVQSSDATSDVIASAPVQVVHDEEMGQAQAISPAVCVTVDAEAHPSVLTRAAAILHEIMRRVIFEGEHILDKIEEVLNPGDPMNKANRPE